jgi:hypothetical protein
VAGASNSETNGRLGWLLLLLLLLLLAQEPPSGLVAAYMGSCCSKATSRTMACPTLWRCIGCWPAAAAGALADAAAGTVLFC